MQVLNKPKTHKLPYSIQRRLESEQCESSTKLPSIPNVYLQPRSKRSKSSLCNNDITISFVKGVNEGKHRLAIRRALATKITFQHNESGQAKILPDKFIKQLKQPIKAIPYSHNKFRRLLDTVRDIFGTDFQIMQKDILAAQGSVTQTSYVFFTSSFYQPYALCCKTIIYLNISDNETNPRKRYAKKESSREDQSIDLSAQLNQKSTAVLTKFICSGCYQTVLAIEMKSPQFARESAIIGKQTILLEEARQKISMSIIVSSGKFKSMRIDKASQKEISIEHPKDRYNPEDQLRQKTSEVAKCFDFSNIFSHLLILNRVKYRMVGECSMNTCAWMQKS